ncbi:hypothetical protein [Carnobacterium maltaromaticum]|uniref:hypothetical protein n=1 Tax=Carnobacterium maltaromaticum TaxID=2751 RepID=UPI0012FC8307|nr:hypothetical protein [Carnobacterium maltaromaticum]
MGNFKFIKKVESMIKPKDIAILQVIAPLSKYIPKKIQNTVINHSAKNNPCMGFVVEPYSLFLCYEILDLNWAKSLLPDGFELTKSKIFSDGELKHYVIFGSFNVHTSAFWGTRLEVNIIAKNKLTGLLSWIIVDYDTNTLSHDKLNGVVESTTEKALLTTDYDGNIIVDIENFEKERAIILDASTQITEEKFMDEDLWLEGNLSVGYGKKISKNSNEAFSLTFNQKEVKKGYRIPFNQININQNTWLKGLFDTKPDEVVYFPYAQHYLSDSPGYYSKIKNTKDMNKRYKNLDLDKIPDYSADSHRKLIKGGLLINSIFVSIVIFKLLKNRKNRII